MLTEWICQSKSVVGFTFFRRVLSDGRRWEKSLGCEWSQVESLSLFKIAPYLAALKKIGWKIVKSEVANVD